MPWSGDADELAQLVNPGDITKLIMLDNWVLNSDRYPPPLSSRQPNYDNVFLSTDGLKGKQRRLVAMDFSDCLKPEVSLTPRIANISNVQDERLFGLFPQFRAYLSRLAYEEGLKRLDEVSDVEMRSIVEAVPDAWDVNRSTRDALLRFLVQRAAFLAMHLPKTLGLYVQVQLGLES